MYKCKSCLYRPQTLKDYVRHYRLHTNIANITFPCAIQDGARHFRTYGAFKSHVARDHQNIKVQRSQALEVSDLATLETQCPFTFLCFTVGDVFESKRCGLVVDTVVVNLTIDRNSKGVMMLFAVYFVLNIVYPVEIAAILKFIQRYSSHRF